VLVNVLVHDHHGNPITDLTKDDFELTDAGKLKKIGVFAVDQIGASVADTKTPAVLPRNVFSNRPGFGIVHDFSNNAAALEAAVCQTRPAFSHQLDGSDPAPSNAGNDNLDANIDGSNAIVSNFFTRNRIVNTCESFKALAEHLGGIPGRKNLVWLTGSVPISIGFGDPADIQRAKEKAGGAAAEQEMFAQYIDEATRALNTANVAGVSSGCARLTAAVFHRCEYKN